jgi:hypothetical protein
VVFLPMPLYELLCCGGSGGLGRLNRWRRNTIRLLHCRAGDPSRCRVTIRLSFSAGNQTASKERRKNKNCQNTRGWICLWGHLFSPCRILWFATNNRTGKLVVSPESKDQGGGQGQRGENACYSKHLHNIYGRTESDLGL